jgi:glutathione S-transferase
MLDDWFKPAPSVTAVTRGVAEQARVDAATAHLALYHYEGCMYCARVRKTMRALALDIELRDILANPTHRAALLAGGGSTTVPCLRIGTEAGGHDRWLYESADIIRFLEDRFGAAS